LSTADPVTRLDPNCDNTAACWRVDAHDLCGIRLDFCRKIECLGNSLLYDLDVADWSITRLVFGIHPILTRVITACQEQQYAERDGKCIMQVNFPT
jgi:hypothetical protein